MPEANAIAQANVSEQKRGFLLCCFVLTVVLKSAAHPAAEMKLREHEIGIGVYVGIPTFAR